MPTNVSALIEIARTSPNWDKGSPELQARHDMMRAKLSGFMEAANGSAPLSAERHLAARALCARDRTYRHSDIRAAVAQIDSPIALQPTARISTN
jgi:hypothetical protein